jgi:hypothetical protein
VQGIVFAGNRKVTPLPYNVGGKIEVEFFWLESSSDGRPYVRLQDHWGEYLVDLKNKKTYQVILTNGRSFAGEVTGGNPDDGGHGIMGAGSEMRVSVGKSRAKEITGLPVAKPGRRLGRIRN